ncbi:MAG TPA: penicillin-binding transpeptidase domain-containing protein [Phycisphaerae bacterium]|nr:penicillin-binding transpeptidase domain-containing protein [Phycisphaerae bacterium]HPS53637.1 penicillin-binding transpeptidase domain-containing protein [Phycisphaerae bacterium]
MYKFRLKILLSLIIIVFLAMLGRLVQMQLVEGHKYREKAKRSLQTFSLIPAQRGRIFDRNGAILATDEACHDFCMDYRFMTANQPWRDRQIRNIAKKEDISRQRATEEFESREAYTWQLAEQAAQQSGEDLRESVGGIRRTIERMKNRTGRNIREEIVSHPVIKGLTESQVNALRPAMEKTVGVSLTPSHKRFYPFADVACHIIGTTRRVFYEDLQQRNVNDEDVDWLERMKRNYAPTDTIGESGVERACEEQLRFTRGYKRENYSGDVLAYEPPKNGKDVQITLDIELQRVLTKIFADTKHTGSIVVMDVPTGEILAMVSWPTYDNNNFRQLYPQLLADKVNLPLHHRAVAATYAPGSTIKPFTGLIASELGRLSADEIITCTGENRLARNGKPRCFIYKEYHTTHGDLTLSDALKVSCNIYFVTAADRIGSAMLAQKLHDFGFGEYPHTGLPEERDGIVGDETYLRKNFNRGFYRSDAWFIGMGQGVFTASPIQIAAAVATIARDGVYLSPKLMRGDEFPQKVRQIPIPQHTLDMVREGMGRVVNEQGGTAYKTWNLGEVPDVTVCGKTGTAQTPPMRIDSNHDGKITTDDTIVKTGDMSWMMAFAPKDNPQIAVSVLVEYSDGGGGADCGPIVKEVVRQCEKFGYIKGAAQ